MRFLRLILSVQISVHQFEVVIQTLNTNLVLVTKQYSFFFLSNNIKIEAFDKIPSKHGVQQKRERSSLFDVSDVVENTLFSAALRCLAFHRCFYFF